MPIKTVFSSLKKFITKLAASARAAAAISWRHRNHRIHH
jgi:hypothetical protein